MQQFISVLKRLDKEAAPVSLPYVRRSSVAVVLRWAPSSKDADLEILFLKRAERPNDKWSGHVCFPGGHAESNETDWECAIRETKEETGIHLDDPAQFQYLARLRDREVRPRSSRMKKKMALCSFVFLQISNDTLPITLQTSEIASFRWVSIRNVLVADSHLTELKIGIDRYPLFRSIPSFLLKLLAIKQLSFPAISLPPPLEHSELGAENSVDHQSWSLWGLTLSVLYDLCHDHIENVELKSNSLLLSSSPYTFLHPNSRNGLWNVLYAAIQDVRLTFLAFFVVLLINGFLILLLLGLCLLYTTWTELDDDTSWIDGEQSSE